MATDELTYKLSGTIRHLGLPVSSVSVALFEAGHSAGGADRVLLQQQTGARGDFCFAVIAGTYCLEIVPHGSTRFVRQLIPGISVSNNTSINATLTTGFILDGTVRTEKSEPVASCFLTVLGIDPSGFRSVIAVSEAGRYSAVLPRGKYYLVPSVHRQGTPADESGKQTPFLTTYHEVIEVTNDASHDVVLPELVKVKAQVVDAAGRPVSGTVVSISRAAAPDNPLAPELSGTVKGTTNRSGIFEVMLEQGDCSVVVTPPARSPYCEMSFQSMTLGKQETERFELVEGVRLCGKVAFQGSPVGGSAVGARSKGSHLAYSTVADSDGKFSFRLPAGSYELTVIPKRERRRKHTEPMGAPWSRTIVAGEGETRVDVALGVAIPVAGHVRDSNGRARSGVTVEVFVDRGSHPEPDDQAHPLAKAVTDSTGRFRLMLAAGKYWTLIAGYPAAMRQVEIKDEPVSVELRYQGCHNVQFHVVGDADAPIARCKVSWNPYGAEKHQSEQASVSDPQAATASGMTFTGDDGSCEFILPAGVYAFHFEPVAHDNHDSKEIRQLSISMDTQRKVKLPLKPAVTDEQLTLDFSPGGDPE